MKNRRSPRLIILVCASLLFAGTLVLWIALTNQQDAVFGLHNDAALAVYLLLQIGAVYAAMLYVACVGTLILERRAITRSDFGLGRLICNQRTVWSCVGAVCGIPLVLLASGLWSGFLTSLFHIASHSRDTLLTRYSTLPISRAVMILLITVIGPMCEEVLFRGFVCRQLARNYHVVIAVLVSATLFATGHFDLVNAGMYEASGVVLAVLALRTGSIVPGIIWHGLVNLLFVVVVLLH